MRLNRRPAAERVVEARRHLGRRVVLTIQPFTRNTREEAVGLLVSAALTRFGTINDVVVLRDERGYDTAFSLATVLEIEDLTW